MEEQYRKFRIILKSGKEFEISVKGEKFIRNLADINEIADKEEKEINLFKDDKEYNQNFFVRFSEVAAIVEIKKEKNFDDEEIRKQALKDLEEITGKKFR